MSFYSAIPISSQFNMKVLRCPTQDIWQLSLYLCVLLEQGFLTFIFLTVGFYSRSNVVRTLQNNYSYKLPQRFQTFVSSRDIKGNPVNIGSVIYEKLCAIVCFDM